MRNFGLLAAVLLVSCSSEEPNSRPAPPDYCSDCLAGTRCGSAGGGCRVECGDDHGCERCEFCDGEGLCAPGPCRCSSPAECDDGDPCTGEEQCTSAVCVAGTPVTCEPSTNPCFSNTCQDVGGVGECVLASNDSCPCIDPSQCDDADACNGAETCDVTCQPGTPVTFPPSAPCLFNLCETVAGIATPVPTPGEDGDPCNDDLFCTAPGACDVAGNCIITANTDCSDGIECTADSCNEGTDQCDHAPNNGLCVDVVGCTIDTCVASVGCEHAPDDAACNDSIDCSDDYCDVTTGCEANPVHQYCADNHPDADPCTVETCDLAAGAGSGCTYPDGNAEDPCDDDNACTTDDVCMAGGGCAGTALPHLDPCEDDAGLLCWPWPTPVCMDLVSTDLVPSGGDSNVYGWRPVGVMRTDSFGMRILATAEFDNNCRMCPYDKITIIGGSTAGLSHVSFYAAQCDGVSRNEITSKTGRALLVDGGWGFGELTETVPCGAAVNLNSSSTLDLDPTALANSDILGAFDNIRSAAQVEGSVYPVDVYFGGDIGGAARVVRCTGMAVGECGGNLLSSPPTGTVEGLALLTNSSGDLLGAMAAMQVGDDVILRRDDDLNGSLEATESIYTDRTVVGSVARPGEGAVYHFGTEGFLARCADPPGWTCSLISLVPDDMNFVAATVSGGDALYLLATSSTGGKFAITSNHLVALPGDVDGGAEVDWRVHTFESASGLFTTGSPAGIITSASGSPIAVGTPSGLDPNTIRLWTLEAAE